MAADLLLLAHAAFVLFAVLGGLLVLRWRWLAVAHVPAAAWAALIEFTGGICPLTPLEQELRRAAGRGQWSGGFVEHYVVPMLYPAGLTREMQVVFGLLVVAMNIAVYVLLWRHHAGRRG